MDGQVGIQQYRAPAPCASSMAMVPAQRRPAGFHLAVVEAVVGQVVLGILDVSATPRDEVEDREAAAEPEYQQVVARRDGAADMLPEVNGVIRARRGVRNVERVTLDVDPDQPLAVCQPQRTLTKPGVRVDHELENVGHRYLSVIRYPLSVTVMRHRHPLDR